MLIQGNAFDIPLADKSVHCVVTSPPYYGLRKYAGDQGEEPLGLEETPERHIERTVLWARQIKRVLRDDGVFFLNYGDAYAGSGKGAANWDGEIAGKQATNKGSMADGSGLPVIRSARAGSLLLMPQRIALALQNDGWIVRRDLIWFKKNPMPESVSGWRWERHRIKYDRVGVDWAKRPKGWQAGTGAHDSGADSKGQYRHDDDQTEPVWMDCPGCDKCSHDNPNFPDGYTLSQSSWRHTTAHEYIFILVKDMGYWANQEAVREDAAYPDGANAPDKIKSPYDQGFTARRSDGSSSGRNPRSVVEDRRETMDLFRAWMIDQSGIDIYAAMEKFNHEMSNPGDVVEQSTSPYSAAHYATYPPDLIAPLIRATCPRWACPECGQGWSPVVEREHKESVAGPKSQEKRDMGLATAFSGYADGSTHPSIQTRGSRPTCEHEHTKAEAVPGIVFDPFIGSGTTGMVARELQRRWIGLDLSMEYIDQHAKIRTRTGSPSGQLEGLPLFGDNGQD